MPYKSGEKFRFPGSYEAEVVEVYDLDNLPDPEECPQGGAGWLKVKIPRLVGNSNVHMFARPKYSIFAHSGGLGGLCLPTTGTKVLVQFVAGDIGTYPMWEGGTGEPPYLVSQDRRVLIYDENGNTIWISKGGDDGKKIKIHCIDGEVEVRASGNVLVHSDGNVNVRGSRIELN